jgi:hypothetical protein
MARSPLLLGVALLFAAIELATAWVEPYGLFHDELYYWSGSRRLGLGYVDHPPLAPWVLAGATALFGDGRLGFRLVPSLCFAGTLLLAGGMARRFGAGAFGQVLAVVCVAAMPFHLALFSFFSVNAIEILLWSATTFLLVELAHTGNPRLWLGIGAVAGLALLDKHTFALLGLGIGAGVLATPLRGQLRGPWPWAAVAIASMLAMPNLVWNAWNGWPSLAFYRSRPAVDLPATPLDAFEIQVLGANPANLLVWVPGVLFLLSRRERAIRALAIVFSLLFVVVLFSGQRRGDRIAGVYPVVLAAGAAFWDRWRGRGSGPVRHALLAVVLACGALAMPATLPILSPQGVARYFDAIGEQPEIEAADVGGPGIPLYLAGRLEWDRFADEVADVWDALAPAERERAVVLAPHWVFASVIEYHGRDRPIGPVVAPHNAWWFWRDEAAGRDVALAVAIPPQVLARYFAKTREVAVFRCASCDSTRHALPIVLATGPIRPLEELLSEWRWFSIEATPYLRP